MNVPPTTGRLLELVDAMAGQPVVMLVDLVADRLHHRHPEADQPRGAGAHPVLPGREADPRAAGPTRWPTSRRSAAGRCPWESSGDDASGRGLLAASQSAGIDTDGHPGAAPATARRPRCASWAAASTRSSSRSCAMTSRRRWRSTAAEREPLRRRLLERWRGEARVAVLSDYGYGAVEPGLLAAAARAPWARRRTLVCDSRYRLGEFAGLDGATPNEEEAEALLGATLDDDPDAPGGGGRRLRERLGARFLLITRGSRGMACSSRRRRAHLPVHGTDQVADVTGAGDTVIGTFALALAAGATPLEAALLANYAGGVVVMKMGTATLTRDELRRAVRDRSRARWRSCDGRGPERRRALAPRVAALQAQRQDGRLRQRPLRPAPRRPPALSPGRPRRGRRAWWWRSTTTTRWRGSRGPAGRWCPRPSAPSCSRRSSRWTSW